MKLITGSKQIVFAEANQLYGGDPVIFVEKGEVYHFEAEKGKVWKDWFISATAAGFWNPALLFLKKRVPGVKCFTLCGTIGENEFYHFPVGSELKEYEIPESGKLYFFANDHIKYYSNNKGGINISVTRIK